MKIVLSTPVFRPLVGGMETMAENLAYHFAKRGHEVTLITPILHDGEEHTDAYQIIRNPSSQQKKAIIREADLVFSNGASLYAVFWSFWLRKTFIWRHTGYQVSCIDGVGWHNDQKVPMRPFSSLLYHLQASKPLAALKGFAKVIILRWVAFHYASANVAISDWMLNQQTLPNAIRIHNPFPVGRFSKTLTNTNYEFDFFFLGRLVSEKGVDTLIEAFAKLNRGEKQYKLCIIGKGSERENLEKLAAQFKVRDQIEFTGVLTGDALLQQISLCRIAVLPSKWGEPFGGVATELLAARKNIIVSKDGALSELVDDAGLTFPNGNVEELYKQMKRLITDKNLQQQQLVKGVERIKSFDENQLITQYLQLFEAVLNKQPLPQKMLWSN
ncbi:MAG: glycosyltransferase family 4 protein [Bacteroidota bacterium]